MNSSTILEKSIDLVLAEVRRIKEEIAAENGYDIKRIIDAARKAQMANSDRIVSRMVIGAEQDVDPNA